MIKLNCKEMVESAKTSYKNEVLDVIKKLGRPPALTVILVGENPASQTYVRKKEEACKELGISHNQINLKEDTTEESLIRIIEEMNHNDNIDGILVQLPLPSHIDEENVINAISPEKDVDGFSPINVGRMILGQDCFIPCTPAGILDVIDVNNIPTDGENVVVFGRSNIVGRPIANLLSQKKYNANVTLLHSHTLYRDKVEYVKNADIIILAVGQPDFLNWNDYYRYIKDGATIIDVGINRIPDSTKKSGFRIVGDFNSKEYEEFDKDMNLKYTPVPGGIGLTTVNNLMSNTIKSAYNKAKHKEG